MVEDIFGFEAPEAKRVIKAVRRVEEWEGNIPRRFGNEERETPQTIRATLKEILLLNSSAKAWVTVIDADGDWRITETEVPGDVHSVAGHIIYSAGTVVVCDWIHGIGYVVVNPDSSVNVAISDKQNPCDCGGCVDTEDTIDTCAQWPKTSKDWYFNAEIIPQCFTAGKHQKISHTTGCNWESATGFNCGSGYTAEKWKLVVSGNWMVLKLQTSIALIQYRKRLDEFNPTCNNEMILDLTGGDAAVINNIICCGHVNPCSICLRPCDRYFIDPVNSSPCFPVTSVSKIYEFTLGGISTPSGAGCSGDWWVFNRTFTLEFIESQSVLFQWLDYQNLLNPCGGGNLLFAADMEHTPDKFFGTSGSSSTFGYDCLKLRIGGLVEYGSEISELNWDGDGNILFGHPVGLAATDAEITAAGFPISITAVPR